MDMEEREHSMTPEERRELFWKADRILETDYGPLFMDVINVFYEHHMRTQQTAATPSPPAKPRSPSRKNGNR